MSELRIEHRTYIDAATGELYEAPIWVLDIDPAVDRVSSCDSCTSVAAIGIDACSGCAG